MNQFFLLLFFIMGITCLYSQDITYKLGGVLYKGNEWISKDEFETLIKKDSSAQFLFQKYETTKAPVVPWLIIGASALTVGAILYLRSTNNNPHGDGTAPNIFLISGGSLTIVAITLEIASQILLTKSIRIYNRHQHQTLLLSPQLSASSARLVLQF